MNAVERYIRKNAGRTDIRETIQLWTQCVAIVKHYVKDVIGISLGRFWGSAKTGWFNKSNTFPSSDWIRTPNDISNSNQLPSVGDVIFFKTNTQWDHVAIVRKTFKENKVEVFEQNTGNWDGKGYDDRARVNTYTYNDCYGWYTPIGFYVEYRGVTVHFIGESTRNPRLLGYYWVKTKTINITPRGRAKNDFEILMEHEWSHHIYWSVMSRDDVKLWEWVSRMNGKTQNWINKYIPGNYWINKYISPGETNESEDFAEVWEDICRNPNTVYGDNRDFDRMVVKKLIEKYT